jgi:hypothetical protein
MASASLIAAFARSPDRRIASAALGSVLASSLAASARVWAALAERSLALASAGESGAGAAPPVSRACLASSFAAWRSARRAALSARAASFLVSP